MELITLDSKDKEILRFLQQDVTVSVSEIAERVGLSTTPCWRRIQQMEANGIITRRVALLDQEKLDLGLTVFVQVKSNQHDARWMAKFAEHVSAFDEVVEFYRMSGEYDYMLKVLVSDIKAFDAFYKRLVAGVDFSDVTSSFAMEQIKNTTALPIR